jgi:HAD superfamily hydrolase (TIGR01509 family)
MVKAIIFDIGGVIQGLDWSPIVNSLLDLKKDLDITKYKNALYHDREKYFDLYSTNKMGKKQFWEMVASKIEIDGKCVDRLSESFELIYSFINHDLIQIIKELKRNYKLFILSNACPEIEKKVIKDNMYVYLFDKIYFSHNINCHKPDKEAYMSVIEENELSPEECLFIDNDIVNIRGAERIGMKVVLYKGVDPLKKEMYEILYPKRGKMSGKEIIGYTTGVFDMFHIGHLNLLKSAKEKCDKLIVGVTTDELSLSFKEKEPVVSFKERLSIVDAVKYVYKAVPQASMNKYEAWQKYRFDIMFASQSPTEKWPKVEKEFLSHFKDNNAPKIELLPRTDGVSSTIRSEILKHG